MDEIKPRLTLRNGRWTVKHQPGVTYRPKALKGARWLAKWMNERADEKRGIEVCMHTHNIGIPSWAAAQLAQQAQAQHSAFGALGAGLSGQAALNTLWNR